MGQARRQPNRRAHCDQVKTKGAPQLGAGRSPAAFFSGMGSRERSGREPMPVLPIPHPMDEVHRGIFIRFAGVLVRCLCFHFSPYVVHAVSENHCKLGTWAVTNSFNRPGPRIRDCGKAMGAPPPPPRENKKIPIPSYCPRFANNRKGTMSLSRFSLAHRMLDTTQPGQLPRFYHSSDIALMG